MRGKVPRGGVCAGFDSRRQSPAPTGQAEAGAAAGHWLAGVTLCGRWAVGSPCRGGHVGVTAVAALFLLVAEQFQSHVGNSKMRREQRTEDAQGRGVDSGAMGRACVWGRSWGAAEKSRSCLQA